MLFDPVFLLLNLLTGVFNMFLGFLINPFAALWVILSGGCSPEGVCL